MPNFNHNDSSSWTFLTNHSHVLICIAQNPEVRMRDIAERVGITERAVQRIVEDLTGAAYLKIAKVGRRNTYTVQTKKHLRHPVEEQVQVGKFLELVLVSVVPTLASNRRT